MFLSDVPCTYCFWQGVAVASNVHPLVGIMTSVWGAFFYSLFSSSHFNICGASIAISSVLNA